MNKLGTTHEPVTSVTCNDNSCDHCYQHRNNCCILHDCNQMPERNSLEDRSGCLSTIKDAKIVYGAPIWQLFYLLMEEEDEETFNHMVEVFRATLRQYRQTKLAEYFEEYYLREDRVKQWAKWYRSRIFGCAWLLNSNMHVESWHNFLKTECMGRLKNVRVDKLIRILIQVEVIYFWKWSRVKQGAYIRRDPGWREMHGDVSPVIRVPSSVTPISCAAESKRTSYVDKLAARVSQIQRYLRTKVVPLDRQRAILTQLTRIANILEHEHTYQANVITTPEPFLLQPESKEKVVPRVVKQYQFKRKKSKIRVVRTDVKAFRKNAANRKNHFLSYSMACGNVVSSGTALPPVISKVVVLAAKKGKKSASLGGITFIPTIGGIVINRDDGKVESLHVKVLSVEKGSQGHAAGVHCQMYLKSLALVNTRVIPSVTREPVFFGAIKLRPRSQLEIEGDIWRNEPNKYKRVDVHALIDLVDSVLTQAIINKLYVECQLVAYKK